MESREGDEKSGGTGRILFPVLPDFPVLRDGGAGNRTLVRVSFQNHVYVRRLDFLPSLQSGIEPTSPKPIS